MTKIEELISMKFFPDQLENLGIEEILEDLMKEYAEFYARQCLRIAEENICVDWIHPDEDDEESYMGIEPNSIGEMQLPEHE